MKQTPLDVFILLLHLCVSKKCKKDSIAAVGKHQCVSYLLLHNKLILNLGARNSSLYPLSCCRLEGWARLLCLWVSSEGPTRESSTSQLTPVVAGRTPFLARCWPKTSLDSLPCGLSHSSPMTRQLASPERASEWARQCASKQGRMLASKGKAALS